MSLITVNDHRSQLKKILSHLASIRAMKEANTCPSLALWKWDAQEQQQKQQQKINNFRQQKEKTVNRSNTCWISKMRLPTQEMTMNCSSEKKCIFHK